MFKIIKVIMKILVIIIIIIITIKIIVIWLLNTKFLTPFSESWQKIEPGD